MTVVGRENMVGSVLDTRHEGETKKPTEQAVLSRLEKWAPLKRKNPDDFVREREEREERERNERIAKEAEREARDEQIRSSIVPE